MIGKKVYIQRTSIFLLLFCSLFILCACGSSSPRSEIQPTVGFDLSKEETLPPYITCPNQTTLYNLYFLHYTELDLNLGGGETVYLEFKSPKESFFQFWIEPSGIITDDYIDNVRKIAYHGRAIHPNSNDCPVQTFDGSNQLQAIMTGFCDDQEGLVKLHIKEEWIDPSLKHDCEGFESPSPGMYSAPELDLVFDLSIHAPTDGVSIPETLGFRAEYAYLLKPASDGLDPGDLEIMPLVPEGNQ